MNLKSKLESRKISDNCYINTYITYDEKKYILEINYMDGKFVSEKEFFNNYKGVGLMEETKGLYNNENDVKNYFGII